MPTIFIPVEISEEELARLSLASKGMDGSYSPVTSSQNPSSSAAGPGSNQGGDPWENATPANQWQPHAQQPQQQYQQQGPPPQQELTTPTCAHGPRILQPAGTNRQTNEQYSAYWKCPLERNTPGRCKNFYPGR